MIPTAISQLIEQIGKVIISLPLAYLGSRVGVTAPDGINIGYAAAGALLGNAIGEAVALFYMTIVYRKNRTVFLRRPQNEDIAPISSKTLILRLLSMAIPITLAACIVPLSAFIDSGMVVNNLILHAGYMQAEARAMYGRYSGYVINYINVPTAFAQAISMSLVPAISSAMARKDWKTVRAQSHTGMRMAFLIGLPCSLGMSMLSRELLTFMYRFTSPEALNQTAELLSMSSYTIVLFTVVQATSGILQGAT